MSYAVKEMFLTLQGEGVNAGARAVFVRFAGCNLWSGREQDRADAVCKFCDTDFVGTDGLGGGKFADAAALAAAVADFWGEGRENRFVVLTGGGPMLQVDDALVDTLHAHGFRLASRPVAFDTVVARHIPLSMMSAPTWLLGPVEEQPRCFRLGFRDDLDFAHI